MNTAKTRRKVNPAFGWSLASSRIRKTAHNLSNAVYAKTLNIVKIKTRSSAIAERPRDALYQLKYWPTVVRITQTDRASAWGAVSATATFYSPTCIVFTCTQRVALGTTITQWACNAVRVINRLPYKQSCWCQLDSNCDQPTSTTTSVVDDTAYYSASAPSWKWTTAADGHIGFKQQKWPSRSLKVNRNGAIREATYDYL